MTRERSAPRDVTLIDGTEMLRLWSKDQIRLIAPYGLYRTAFLRAHRGFEAVVSSSVIALYSEYLLILRAGLGGKIAYTHEPLVFYRHYAGSWGVVNQNVELYREAGHALCEKADRILSGVSPSLRRTVLAKLRKIALEFWNSKVLASGANPGASGVWAFWRGLTGARASDAGWLVQKCVKEEVRRWTRV